MRNFKGRDKEQFKKFSSLPNLIYTNGNEWVLYRDGKVATRHRLSGDVTEDGAEAADERDAEKLSAMLRDFLSWNPIVPSSPKALAELLAPLCRLLRDDVTQALADPKSVISPLACEWRQYLFPEADDARFADAYAQTLTYALLLARTEGKDTGEIRAAAEQLWSDHRLLSQTLELLAQRSARNELSTGIGLLERTISAVDPAVFVAEEGEPDPLIYFYEYFLAAYDSKLRNDSGVYCTPVEVVKVQVNLVAELLTDGLGKRLAFADDGVTVLDPATGTGTYLLKILDHGLEVQERMHGRGMRGSKAEEMARNMHAFEFLVGPYTVAQLKLSAKVKGEGGDLSPEDLHIYLADALESPYDVPRQLPMQVSELGEERRQALRVKQETPVLVCIGNPPYDRQQRDPGDTGTALKGGWVRFSEEDPRERPNLTVGGGRDPPGLPAPGPRVGSGRTPEEPLQRLRLLLAVGAVEGLRAEERPRGRLFHNGLVLPARSRVRRDARGYAPCLRRGLDPGPRRRQPRISQDGERLQHPDPGSHRDRRPLRRTKAGRGGPRPLRQDPRGAERRNWRACGG